MNLTKAVKHQTPEERARMTTALQVSNDLIERWLRSPESDVLNADILDNVRGWTRGEYGIIFDPTAGDNGRGIRLLPRRPSPAVAIPVKPPVAKGNPTDFGDPANGVMHQTLGPQPYTVTKKAPLPAPVKAAMEMSPLGWARAEPGK
ncbi:hypothetical protein GCM10011360_02610 [Primorskyibacter flagellatus]|uniref:Uncharacterized protein n=1 Tax=Primorskyibacter flagellatus TaxID=1387277 RepID=A0A916ZWV0_9RHOB|nr:hypothetical protein [Primorskyibacter flagellatus]GGE17286.1 hypothetical protein GCM10011360_02610 [Primorskyibacter flagellatus]